MFEICFFVYSPSPFCVRSPVARALHTQWVRGFIQVCLERMGSIDVALTALQLEERGVVEMLKNSKLTDVPPYYVKPLHLRQDQKSGAPFDFPVQVPLIDFSSPREVLVEEIRRGCEYGFFQIINHGTPLDLLKRIETQSREFFALPVEEKMKSTTQEKVTGPIHFGGGSRGDWRDVLKIQCAPASEVAMYFWPRKPDGFR